MLLNRIFEYRKTIVFKLVLWYSITFIILIFVSFVAFYVFLNKSFIRRIENDLNAERYELVELLRSNGVDSVKALALAEAESEGVDKVFVRIWDSEGNLVVESDMSSWNMIPDQQLRGAESEYRGDVFVNTIEAGKEHEAVRVLSGPIGAGLFVQIGQSLEDGKLILRQSIEIFAAAMPVLLVFAGSLGWFMARRSLRDVKAVTRTAEEISRGCLERRVSVKNKGDEIERLALTFNEMLDRMQSLIGGMRKVTEDIAHDLRSPISRIRGVAEMTVAMGGSREDWVVMAGNTIEECDRLLEMINALLEISEAESGVVKLKMEFVDMSWMIESALKLFQAPAEDKRIRVEVELPEFCPLHGDKRRLQRMIANLLDNAIKYTPEAGAIRVSLRDETDRIIIVVSDSGVGIPREELPHIFERLYRCDGSRAMPGHGLGLSLAQAVAHAHGGEIYAESRLGSGSTFTIVLPRTEGS